MATRTAGAICATQKASGSCQLLPHIHGLPIRDDGAGGAVVGALAATDAGRVGHGNVAGRGDAGLKAAVEKTEGKDVLILLADLDAAAAGDALARIEHDASRGVVNGQVGNNVVQPCPGQSEIGGQGLQFAIVVALAGQALVRVPRKNQLQHETPDLHNLRSLRQDIHPRLRRACNRRAASCRCF